MFVLELSCGAGLQLGTGPHDPTTNQHRQSGRCGVVWRETEPELVAGVPWVGGHLLDEVHHLGAELLDVLAALILEVGRKERADALRENQGLVLVLRLLQEGVNGLAPVLAHGAGGVDGVATVAEGSAGPAGLEELLGPLVDCGQKLGSDLLAKQAGHKPSRGGWGRERK